MLASASVSAASAFACRSSATLERGMNPIPTSAATKRFSNSLESSSMDSNVGSHEALQQLAGVELHGYPRLQFALVEEHFQRVARAAHLGQQQRILHNFRYRRFILSGQGMMRRRDHDRSEERRAG